MNNYLSEFGETPTGTTPSQDSDIAWLTGIIEGEGSVSWYREKKHGKRIMGLIITNTDECLLKGVSDIYERLGVKFSVYDRSKYQHSSSFKSRKKCYEITARRTESLIKLYPLIYPYMRGEKSKRVKKTLEYLAIITMPKPKILCQVCQKETNRKHTFCSQKCWHEYSVGNKNPNYRHGNYQYSGVTTERQTPEMVEATV